MPSNPSSAIRRYRSAGHSSVRSISLARGATSFSANARTISTIRRCTSVSSKSMLYPMLAVREMRKRTPLRVGRVGGVVPRWNPFPPPVTARPPRGGAQPRPVQTDLQPRGSSRDHPAPPPHPQRSRLPIAPDLLKAPEVEDGLMRDHVLHVRPHGEVVEPPAEDRARRLVLELLLDPRDQRQPLLGIELRRLRVDQLL